MRGQIGRRLRIDCTGLHPDAELCRERVVARVCNHGPEELMHRVEFRLGEVEGLLIDRDFAALELLRLIGDLERVAGAGVQRVRTAPTGRQELIDGRVRV